MNATTEACTEAWKFQQCEWLYDADKATVAIARSWFSAGWTAGTVWQASRPITDEQVGAAAKVLYDDYASEYEYAPWELGDQTPFLTLAHTALEAARGVQS